MSYTVKELLKLASDYDNVATRALVVTAAKKEKKKLDPKAKVRNRGTVCIPAESAKDKKDHFPINNEAQARNALARVNQFSKVPDWYSGSLQGLVSLVARKVKSKYPSIEVSKDAKKPGKKKASEYYDELLNKYSQTVRQPTSFQRGEGTIEFPDNEGNFNFPSTPAPKPSLPFRPEVQEVQKYLINLHPDFAAKLNAAGGADGKFGPATQEVVKYYAQNSDANAALQASLKKAREVATQPTASIS